MGSTQANNTLGSSSRDYGKPPSLVSAISSTGHRPNSGSHRDCISLEDLGRAEARVNLPTAGKLRRS